jgi:hypothetical protein
MQEGLPHAAVPDTNIIGTPIRIMQPCRHASGCWLLDIFNPSEIIDFVTFQGHAQVGAPRWKGFTGVAYHQVRLPSEAKVYSVT